MNGHERISAFLDGQPVDRLPLMPITMMFAADQSHVRYGDYARDHRVMAAAQMQVARAFDFDHVSVISDPAREAADCGAAVHYFPDQPPAIDETEALLGDKAAFSRLRVPDPLGGGRMHDRVKGIALLREAIGGEKSIEGWVEGPCAEAADLRGINHLMMDFADDPDFVRELFDFAVRMELRFAKAQVDAGCDFIGVGDAAASLVGPKVYEEFVWPFEKRLVDGLHALGTRVRLHICGNTRKILAGMGTLGCEIVDLDFPAPVSEGRKAMGPAQILLGNANPVEVLRNGSAEAVAKAFAACHAEAGPRYIVGAGCEICRDTPLENVRAMCDYAKSHVPGSP